MMSEFQIPNKNPFTEAGLTRESMITEPGAEYFRHPSTMHHDISIMNQEQLSRYVKMAFLGQRDYDFLPQVFWDDAYAGSKGSGVGKMHDGASKFFGSMYGFVGRVNYVFPDSEDEVERTWVGYPVHAEYRQNLRSAILDIVDECEAKDKPTKQEIILAQSVLDAAICIALEEGTGKTYSYQSNHMMFERIVELAENPEFAPHIFDDETTRSNFNWLKQMTLSQ